MDSTTLYLILVLLGGAPQMPPAALANCATLQPGAKQAHAGAAKVADCRVQALPVLRHADSVVPRAQLRGVAER